MVFLPIVAHVSQAYGWRPAALGTTSAALVVIPFVAWLLRDRPSDVGAMPYGGTAADELPRVTGNAARTALAGLALAGLALAARTRVFWLLAAGFAICGRRRTGWCSRTSSRPPTTTACR